jgi:hypothetical protein
MRGTLLSNKINDNHNSTSNYYLPRRPYRDISFGPLELHQRDTRSKPARKRPPSTNRPRGASLDGGACCCCCCCLSNPLFFLDDHHCRCPALFFSFSYGCFRGLASTATSNAPAQKAWYSADQQRPCPALVHTVLRVCLLSTVR